jgi:hypothetical protein
MFFRIDFQIALNVGSPGHHVHRTWISVVVLWGYIKDRLYRINPHTVQELQADMDAVAEEIRGDTLSDTIGNSAFQLQLETTSNYLISNMCSHKNHNYTNFPRKWTFIHVIICFCTLENYEYILHRNCCVFFWISCMFFHTESSIVALNQSCERYFKCRDQN